VSPALVVAIRDAQKQQEQDDRRADDQKDHP
jgi:hypothetical protein